MKQQFRKICTQTAIWYSLLVFVYSFVTMILNLRSEGGPGASAERILLFLPFSILFSLANLILSGEKADPIVRWALHCALTVGGGFLCVILPLGGKGAQLFIGFLMMLVAYAVIALVIVITKKRLRSAVEHDSKLKKLSRQNHA